MAVAALVHLTGCVDPGGDFDAFTRRTAGKGAIEAPSDCDALTGDLPEPGELSGRFLLSVSTTLGRDTPFVYVLDVEAERRGDSYEVTMSAQPLAADDRSSLVGMPSEPETFTVMPSGCFESPAVTFQIPAAANPILPVAAVAELSFQGSVSSALLTEDGAVSFWCGTVNGRTVTPLPMSIDGSTFAASRITDMTNLPQALLDCEMTSARPL